MQRRSILGLGMLLLGLSGCAAEPPDFSFGGQGFQPDNVRLNLSYAERNFGDMSLYRGKPAEAAAALAQFEASVAGMRVRDNNIALTSLEATLINAAIRQTREAVGIPLNTDPMTAAEALSNAVGPLQRQDQAAIRTALSNPIFTLGPDATAARLANLPPLRDLESVAPELTHSALTVYGGDFHMRYHR